MPSVDKQAPPKPAGKMTSSPQAAATIKKPVASHVVKATKGSILALAKPVEAAVDERISLVLYGRNRIGKTTLACMFPKPLLLLSLEPTKTGGARSVSKVPGVKWLRLNDSESIAQVAQELMTTNHGYASVVIDSVTSHEKIVLREVRGDALPLEMLRFGKVSQDEYTLRSEKMRDAIRPFLELDMHCIILGNEKDHNPPEGRKSALTRSMQESSFFATDAGGGLARWLMDSCDYVVQMFMDRKMVDVEIPGVKGQASTWEKQESDELIRRLRLKYHPNFAAGTRSPNEEALPEFVDGNGPMELYTNFLTAIRNAQ